MENPISTRRALEVCLARLPMHDESRKWFFTQLQNAIQKGEPTTPDSENWRLETHQALAALADVTDTFPKRALVARIREAKAHLRRALGDT